jgi:hypothetical protein
MITVTVTVSATGESNMVKYSKCVYLFNETALLLAEKTCSVRKFEK